MATTYDRIKERLAVLRRQQPRHHAANEVMVNFSDLKQFAEDYDDLLETCSSVARMVPPSQAHIEDVFTAFQEFFSDVQKMQTNWPVAAWGKQLDIAREKLKASLATIGLAQHIIWEPRE